MRLKGWMFLRVSTLPLPRVRARAKVLESALWSGSCIKYWTKGDQRSVETWLQRSKRTRQRKTSGRRRPPQKENAQSHICQNLYGPHWGRKPRLWLKSVESPAAEAEQNALLMTCEIRIGTSGYHYKHWRGPFYPTEISPNEMLEFYSQQFDTVELNNRFYRLPTEAAFDNWRQSTPAGFVFAVKASRFLTHQKKLKDPESALQNFLPRASRLSTKLGPLLFQLPPRWRVNPGRLEGLLEALPRDLRCTFEFRDLSWIRADINKLLARFGAALPIGRESSLRRRNSTKLSKLTAIRTARISASICSRSRERKDAGFRWERTRTVPHSLSS
jgi:hypothetical protein